MVRSSYHADGQRDIVLALRATDGSRPMIPYFDGHLFDRRPACPIHLFGVLVAIGVILGDRIVVQRGRQAWPRRQRRQATSTSRIVIGGFIVAHLVSVLFYFPERIKENPLVLLNIWSPGCRRSAASWARCSRSSTYTKKDEDPPPRLRRRPWRWGCRSAGSSAAPAASPRTTTRAATPSFFLAVRYPDGAAPRSRPLRAAVHDRADGDAVPLRAQAAPRRSHHRPRRAAVRAGPLRARFPARHRRGPPRRALPRR